MTKTKTIPKKTKKLTMSAILFSDLPKEWWRKMTLWTATMVIILTMSVSALAATDVERSSAREAVTKATAAFNLGHYLEAIAAYEDAYRLVQDPVLLYNIGQAYRLSGDNEKALTAYRSYLRTAPENAPNRDVVVKKIAEIEWAEENESQKKLSTTPVPVPVPVPVIEKAKPPMVVETPQPKVEPTPTPWSKKWLPWIGVGVTTVLVASAIATWYSAKSDFDGLKGSCGQTKACTDSQLSGVKSKILISNVLWGLTAASALGTGITFYIVNTGNKNETGVSFTRNF